RQGRQALRRGPRGRQGQGQAQGARRTASGRDVPDPRADHPLLPRDRALLRRPRPLHGDVRRAEGRRGDRGGRRARARGPLAARQPGLRPAAAAATLPATRPGAICAPDPGRAVAGPDARAASGGRRLARPFCDLLSLFLTPCGGRCGQPVALPGRRLWSEPRAGEVVGGWGEPPRLSTGRGRLSTNASAGTSRAGSRLTPVIRRTHRPYDYGVSLLDLGWESIGSCLEV